MNYFFNPADPTVGVQTVAYQQWRNALSKWLLDIDSVEATLTPDVEFFRAPDGDYWRGTNPGAFTPASSRAISATEENPAQFDDNEVGA